MQPMRKYKIFQREEGKVVVVIFEDKRFSKDATTRFINICHELLGEEIKIDIQTQGSAKFSLKYRPVTSEVRFTAPPKKMGKEYYYYSTRLSC